MSTQDNTSKVNVSPYEQKWLNSLNNGNISSADEVFMPGCVIHINGGAQPDLSLDQYKQMVTGLLGAFPDLHFTVHDQFITSDKVATRWTATGTNTKPFGEVNATGRHMQIGGLIIDYLKDGKVAERWEMWDQMSMLQQLGLA